MVFRQIIFFFLLCVISGCHKPSEEEINAIQNLNKEFKGYKFTSGNNISGVYLNVTVPGKIDTLMINKIFDASVGKSKENLNKTNFNWVYLNVFDSSGDYRFTVSKDDSVYNYFQGSDYP